MPEIFWLHSSAFAIYASRLSLWISFNKLGKSFSFWVRKVRPQEMCTNVNKQFSRTVCQFIWLLGYLSLLSNSVGLFPHKESLWVGHCELNFRLTIFLKGPNTTVVRTKEIILSCFFPLFPFLPIGKEKEIPINGLPKTWRKLLIMFNV